MSPDRDTQMVREDDVIRACKMVIAGEITHDDAIELLDHLSIPESEIRWKDHARREAYPETFK